MWNPFRRTENRDLSRAQLTALNYGYGATQTGISVSEENSLTLASVYSVCDRYTSTIAGLDFQVYTETGREKQILPSHDASRLMRTPNPDINANKFRRAMFLPLFTSGNSYVEIVRNKGNVAKQLHLIPWRNVETKVSDSGRLYYLLRREGRVIEAASMLHFTGLTWNGLTGVSPIQTLRQTLSVGMAAERVSASVYGNGCSPTRGYWSTEQLLTPETSGRLKSQLGDYKGVDNAGKSPVLEQGVKFISTEFSPEDVKLIESRDYTTLDVCRAYQIPPTLLFAGGQVSDNASEESYRQWIQTTVRNLLEGIEEELEFKLLDEDERDSVCFEFDLDCLLRGDPKARNESMRMLWMMGALSPDEARAIDGRNPQGIEGSDKPWVPVNMRPMDAPQPDPTQPNPANPLGGDPGPETPDPLDVKSSARKLAREDIRRVLRRGSSMVKDRRDKGKLSDAWLSSYLEDYRTHVRETLPSVVELLQLVGVESSLEDVSTGLVTALEAIATGREVNEDGVIEAIMEGSE